MAASAWHFICLARASKDHSERYKVRVSAAEAPAPEDCAVTGVYAVTNPDKLTHVS